MFIASVLVRDFLIGATVATVPYILKEIIEKLGD